MLMLFFFLLWMSSTEAGYPTPLKCQDKEGSNGDCTVSFLNWRDDQTHLPQDHIVCGVSIIASIRSFPLTCPSYSIKSIDIAKKDSSQWARQLDWDPLPPDVTSCGAKFVELGLRMRNTNQTDLQYEIFCTNNIQPNACTLTSPQLTITTTKWDKSTCASEACPDDTPLNVNVDLLVTSLPLSSCPMYNNQICSGSLNRPDELQRGSCGCRTEHNGLNQGNTQQTCTCNYGYLGDACQLECPGGQYQPGQSGLSNCCSGHGDFFQYKDSKTNKLHYGCTCMNHWTGNACDRCSEGYYEKKGSEDGEIICTPCKCGAGSEPGTTCNEKTGACQCVNDEGWNPKCTDCREHFFGSLCSHECSACNATGSAAPVGACDSGINGTGSCKCAATGWNVKCTNCKKDYWGRTCAHPCECKTNEECTGKGITGDGTCECLKPYVVAQDDTCGLTPSVDNGGIPPWVAAVVAVVVVVFGVIMFVVLYRRQMQYQQNLNEVMTSGGASYNGYHSAGDSNGSQWDSNGIQRGRRSIDMARPLLGSEEENEAGGRYPRASFSSALTATRSNDAGMMYQVSSPGSSATSKRAHKGSRGLMSLLLDGIGSETGSHHQRTVSKVSAIERFDRLLLSTSSKTMMKGGSSGEGGVDYMIDYSMLTMGEKIGSGASGEVFTATVDVNPDEEPIVVAVKKLFADTVDKDYFGSAFRRELQILRRMDHPNVVRLIGVSISPDSHYHIVTELCRCALNDLLDRGRGRLPDHILIDITLQMVHGMKYLHENKIVHRDLKPANCLIMGGGDRGNLEVKICDFGLSRLVQHDVTMMTAEIGTPAYMAPEMASEGALDSVEAGKAIDVYSFSICCLEIWTQDRPYKNKKLNAFQLMVKVMKGQRPEIPNGRVPPQVQTMIRLCWSQTPSTRPSFAAILKLMEENSSFFIHKEEEVVVEDNEKIEAVVDINTKGSSPQSNNMESLESAASSSSSSSRHR